MKKKLFGFFAVLMLLMFAVPQGIGTKTGIVQTVEAASYKNKLVKKKGNYYYYDSKGKKVKNTWKKISGKKYYFDGKGRALTQSAKVKNTYYVFDKKGRLYQPTKGTSVKVGKDKYYKVKIGKKEYYVNKKGKAIKGGVYSFKSDKMMYFRQNGLYDSKITKKLNSLIGYEKDWKPMKELLESLGEKPLKTTTMDTCYITEEGGVDVVMAYKYFGISIFQGNRGTAIMYGVEKM